MKIVSKYKDYYDAGLVYGIDEKLYFKRETKKDFIHTNYFHFSIFGVDFGDKFYVDFEPHIIGFCGEFYPVFEVRICSIKNNGDLSLLNTIFIYSYNDFLECFIDLGCELTEMKHYKGSLSNDVLIYNKEKLDIRLDNIENFFGHIIMTGFRSGEKQDYADHGNMFKNNNIYFVISRYNEEKEEKVRYPTEKYNSAMTVHPILKDYKFSKIKDAYKAFQEISMFLGKMRDNDEEILEIDDKHKAFSKGYCCHSFRKKPTKKKKKKCGKKMNIE